MRPGRAGPVSDIPVYRLHQPKEFRSMKKVTFLSKNGQDITISAVINFPQGFDESNEYPAVVVAHPGGGVKEQTAGLYARKLAEEGLVTIATATVPLAPLRKEDAPNKELEEPGSTTTPPRGQYPTAPGFATARRLNQIITYDAYNMAEVFLTQPLQVVAGSVAGSKWMSDDLSKRTASTNKQFHVVEGSNHMQLYDVPQYVDAAVSVLPPFSKQICRCSSTQR